MRNIKKGATDQSVVIRFVDSTDGTPETGVVAATAGLAIEYRRELAASTSIGVISDLAALTTAHTDAGIKHIGNGYYRVDLPDAAVATGANGVLVHGTATGMVVIGCYVHLVDYDPQDTVRLGLTALPNAAAEAAGGLYTRGTGAGQINQAANGMIDTNPVRLNNVSQSLLDLKDFADDGYDPATNKVQGVVLVDTITTYTGNTPQTGDSFARIGAAGAGLTVLASATDLAIVAGYVDTEIGTIITHLTDIKGAAWSAATDTLEQIRDRGDAAWITATGFSTHSAADVWAVATRVLTAGTNIVLAKGVGVTGFNDPAAADNADAVWDELLSGHAGVGSTGAALSAAGGSGDPWSTALPGAYGAGTAGKIIGDNINATISSRASQTSVDDIPTNAEFDARTLLAANYATAANQATIIGLIDTEVGTLVTNVAAILVDTTQLQAGLIGIAGTVSDATPATNGFTTSLTQADNHWTDHVLVFTGGSLVGQSRIIAIYNNLGGEVAFDELWTSAPANGDPFIILANHAHSKSQIADAIFDELMATHVTAGTFGKAVNDILDIVGTTGTVLTAAERTAITNAILDLANTIGTRSIREIFKLLAASQGGKVSGALTPVITIRDIDDTKDAIVADVDADGNRLTVALDLT